MIKIKWKGKTLDFESVEWSGTDNQCSRQLTFTVPVNPYDKMFKSYGIALGDLVKLYSDKKLLFLGTITAREKTAAVGTASYTAVDFMQHLLRSTGTYIFRNTTPEAITKRLCTELKIKIGSLVKTKIYIKRLIYEEQDIYDIIVGAYRKAKPQTKKKYMPVMEGSKFSVIEKGLSSGVKLTQGVDITDASYNDTTDNIVNKVDIYSDSRVKLGQIENRKSQERYGIYQSQITKEKDTDAKKEALALLTGVTKEASVEALGDVRAISGRSIIISDKATGLKGTFYISSDTHTFSNGVHTMSLDLSWVNEMESGAEETSDDDKFQKQAITNDAVCYYLENSKVYHSTTECSSCTDKAKKSTVAELKKILVTRGTNKGMRKYRPCAKCWEESSE